jgi:hypothetical protein
MNRKPPEECTEPEVCSANQQCEHDCTYKRIMRAAKHRSRDNANIGEQPQ